MNDQIFSELGLQGVTGVFELGTDEALAEIEEQIRNPLPSDYRHFLMNYTPSLFMADVVFTSIEPSLWAVDGAESLDLFYGLSSDPGFDIRSVNKRLEGLPEKAIAIGHDAGSNAILLDLPKGEVLFFDKESGACTLIATTFLEFINSFKLRE